MFFACRPPSGASPSPLLEVLLALPYRFQHVFFFFFFFFFEFCAPVQVLTQLDPLAHLFRVPPETHPESAKALEFSSAAVAPLGNTTGKGSWYQAVPGKLLRICDAGLLLQYEKR